MERYKLHEAEERLAQLIDDAQSGMTVLIVTDDERVVQLVPVQNIPQPRTAGSARGKIVISADFDAPVRDFDDYAE